MTAVTKIRTDEAALRKTRMLIGGKWVDSASGEMLEVEDPAHRRPIAEVPRGGAEDVARAAKVATDAFPAWSRTVPRERGRLLARIADATRIHQRHSLSLLLYRLIPTSCSQQRRWICAKYGSKARLIPSTSAWCF